MIQASGFDKASDLQYSIIRNLQLHRPACTTQRHATTTRETATTTPNRAPPSGSDTYLLKRLFGLVKTSLLRFETQPRTKLRRPDIRTTSAVAVRRLPGQRCWQVGRASVSSWRCRSLGQRRRRTWHQDWYCWYVALAVVVYPRHRLVIDEMRSRTREQTSF